MRKMRFICCSLIAFIGVTGCASNTSPQQCNTLTGVYEDKANGSGASLWHMFGGEGAAGAFTTLTVSDREAVVINGKGRRALLISADFECRSGGLDLVAVEKSHIYLPPLIDHTAVVSSRFEKEKAGGLLLRRFEKNTISPYGLTVTGQKVEKSQERWDSHE